MAEWIVCYLKNEISSAQKPSVDLQESMLAASFENFPKFEKIKPKFLKLSRI
ncbi:MAG: hypothetical protein RLZZ205_382 [Bacteroidota bacterium]